MKKMTTARFIVLLLCLYSLSNTSKAQVHPDDSLQLISLYNATCNSGCTLDWNFTQPVSTWQGIVIDENNRVTEIDLEGVSLSGDVPNPVSPYLTHLNLSDNNLNGLIPNFDSLPNLKRLNLGNNDLTGPIPDFDGLPNLEFLNLYRNPLYSGLPDFSNLPKLKGFSLFQCQLTGAVPDFSNLPELIWFYLDNNNLSGAVPNFSNTSKLVDLFIRHNDLTGTIPNFDNLPNLERLYLVNNQFEGEIPDFAQCSSLSEIDLSYNELVGEIPPSFSDLPNLNWLVLNNNQLECCFDTNLFGLCTQLDSVSIDENNDFIASWENFCNSDVGVCQPNTICSADSLMLDSLQLVNLYNTHCNINIGCNLDWDFNQPISTWQGITVENNRVTEINLEGVGLSDDVPNLNFSRLQHLYFGDNNFTGQIPDFDSLPNLVSLYLHENPLNSTVPDFSNLSKLKGFSFFDCGLTGTIPDFSNLPELLWFYLDNNDLTGTVPNLSNTPKLIDFFAMQNNLEGTVPNFDNLPNLEKLSLSVNHLKGEMPDFAQCPNITQLNLAYNQISGNLHSIINNLDSLTILILNRNQLNDTLPSSIGSLVNLEIASLSNNQFTGNIPTTIQNLTKLRFLGLHKNQFSGNIPDFSNLPDLEGLSLEKNKFSFDAIASAYYNNNSINDFQYSPQYHGEPQGYTKQLVDTLTLSLSEPLKNVNNINYQWKKNNVELAENTDSIIIINDLQLGHTGKYTLHATDFATVPDLEIISEPIYVIVPGYDLYGQPVAYNQIMMEFDDETDKENYENEYLYPNAGIVTDSCNCNRELYLWQFPSDTAALEVLLAVNTKKEKIDTRRADVDGGLNNIFNVGPIVSGEGWTWSGNYLENYPDTAIVFLLDSGADILNWNTSPYLFDTAPVDICHDTLTSSGFDYADTLSTISGSFTDSLGHGTYGFRSIAEGLNDYMNLKVVPLKVFNGEGQGTLFNFVCALYHAIDHDADIIHVSAGYAGQVSDILENAIAFSKEQGCLLVTAAGNDGANIDSIPQYPAYYAKEFYKEGYDGNDSLVHYNNVISVASIGPQDELSTFSNYGIGSVLLSAYGEDMSGYSHTGDKVSSSGSSVSAFYVTRELAAEIAKDKTRNYEQIWQHFETNRLRDCPATTGLTKTGKCLDINLNEVYGNLRAYLEGPYDATIQKMSNGLNVKQLLPGQSHGDCIPNHSMATQPYDSIAPYNYQGNESVPSGLENYPSNVVDWILISLRTEIEPDTEVSRTAAWLSEHGDIQLLRPLFEHFQVAPDSVFVVIEHRNHMAVMSPQKVPVERNIITWDFIKQDGYKTSTTTGQIELQPGIWAMLTGDGKQSSDIEGYDINGDDKTIWQDDNGRFLLYLPGDYNMDGDVNGTDKWLWEQNNGKFSGVPR